MFDVNTAQARRDWLTAQSVFAGPITGSTPDAGSGPASAADMWRCWMALGNPAWPRSSSPSGDTAGSVFAPSPVESLSWSLFSGGQVYDYLRRMADGPQLADAGGPERRMAQLTEQWLAVQESVGSYERVLAGAWTEINTRFTAELSSRYRSDSDVPDAKSAFRIWLDVANQVLLEAHRSEAFLDAQRRLLRDGMDFIISERRFVEGLVEPAGLPTRSEIDEVHHALHELKRRVKALEKSSSRATDGHAPALASEADLGVQP
jgi:hypothetical protein